MNENKMPFPGRPAGARYSVVRTLARLRFALRRTNLLWADRIAPAGGALLVVNAPPRAETALSMTAAFEQPLQWIFQSGKMNGFSARLLAACSAAVRSGGASGADPQIVACCQSALMGGRPVAVFAGGTSEKDGQAAGGLSRAAHLAVELAKGSSSFPDLAVHVVSVYSGNGRLGSDDVIYVAAPVYPREFLHRANGDAAAAAESLGMTLEEIRNSNPCKVFPPELSRLLQDLAEILRFDLRDDWNALPGWRQDASEFELSGLVVDWAGRTNVEDPSSVVALRALVERFHNSRQKWAAREFAAEVGGHGRAPIVQRTVVWLETVLGFAVAIYGAVNHLVAAAIYAFLRRLERPADKGGAGKWIAGGIGVLCGYTIQILLCNHWFGRAAAGYYALTLPLAGAYLWRYAWLLRNRTGAALAALFAPLARRSMVSARRAVVSELSRRTAQIATSAGTSP